MRAGSLWSETRSALDQPEANGQGQPASDHATALYLSCQCLPPCTFLVRLVV